MKSLRKGDRGSDVLALQEQLIKAGYNIKPDTIFWNETEQAVRNFQRKNALIADGVAGFKTLVALDLANKKVATMTSASMLNDLMAILGVKSNQFIESAKLQPLANSVSRPASQYSTSGKGLKFIYTLEAYPGISNRLHWPKGASGVTLGPGYVMKMRNESEIVKDMVAIGLDAEVARKISKASGLQNNSASEFCKDNKKLVNLNADQEIKLLKHIVPNYESIVKRNISIDLLQYEFDALMCFAYNPGGQFKGVSNNINKKQIGDAMKIIKKVVKSGGEILPALVKRREREIALFMYGDYGKLRTV